MNLILCSFVENWFKIFLTPKIFGVCAMLSWCGCWLMLLLGSSGPTVGQVAVGGAVAGAGRSSSPLAGGPRLGRPPHTRTRAGWRPEPEPEIHTLSPFISPLMVTRTPCKPGNEAWSFTNTERVPTRVGPSHG